VNRFAICTFLVFSIDAQCSAAPIAINNPSFESPDTPDATKSNVLTGWSNFHGNGMQQGVFDPDNTSYSNASGNSVSLPGTATGYQVCFFTGAGNQLRQNVGTLLPNTTYTLTVAYGIPLLSTGTGWITLYSTSGFLATNKGFSGVAGAFVDRSVSYTTGNLVSGDLIIELGSIANETHYDNVRLDAVTVPEPSFLAMLSALLVTQNFCRRRMDSQRSSA
jgi:hypothetical protein